MNERPRRILVVLPTWVGDAVMATPTLRALRKGFPEAHIAVFGSTPAREVLSGLEPVRQSLPDASRRKGLGNTLRAARRLAAESFDMAVLLSNAFRVALLCRLGRCGRLVGYDRDGRGWLLSDRLDPPRLPRGGFAPVPALDYYLRLAEHLGCDVSDRRMELAVEAPCAAEAAELFAQAGIVPDRPVVMLNPGASFGSSKLWPAERFAAVGDALHERRGAQIIINAAPVERPIAAAVAMAMRHAPAISFANLDNTLGLLKAVTARCELVITGDTGPRHVAAALGAGVVTIFGATDPAWTVIDYPRERIVRADVPCGPCQQKLCPLPAGEQHHACMQRITPETVLAAAEELLETPREPAL